MQVRVQEATIKTATVEIRTLAISGKQVTLAVFRQLQVEPLIDDEGNLRGQPWGLVNYFPDKDNYEPYLHVVWQHGDLLRRAKVYKPRRIQPPTLKEDVQAWLCARALDGWKPEGYGTHQRVTIGGFTVDAEIPAAARYYNMPDYVTDEQRARERKERLAEELQTFIEDTGHVEPGATAIWATMLEDIDDENRRYSRYRENYDQIAALDQLFIAV